MVETRSRSANLAPPLVVEPRRRNLRTRRHRRTCLPNALVATSDEETRVLDPLSPPDPSTPSEDAPLVQNQNSAPALSSPTSTERAEERHFIPCTQRSGASGLPSPASTPTMTLRSPLTPLAAGRVSCSVVGCPLPHGQCGKVHQPSPQTTDVSATRDLLQGDPGLQDYAHPDPGLRGYPCQGRPSHRLAGGSGPRAGEPSPPDVDIYIYTLSLVH